METGDKIRENFMAKVFKTAETMYTESIGQIEEEFIQKESEIARSFAIPLFDGLKRYASLEREKAVGELKYIYVSFLRTSIIAGSPNYRLDFYDDRNRCSLIECSEEWNFNYIFDFLKHIDNSLKKMFKEQTRVPEYELDNIIFELAEHYRKISDKKIDSVIKYMIENREEHIAFNHTVKIYIGDFLDKVSFVLDCDRL
ncbi:hypothetical protein D3Z50_03545 [Clostridiaceae bacterium]|jgi:hypothetical protein|nr:hypothetical protein [Clostridium sp.]NBI70152.1 hypothetical protein [Clostridiaceae bacterium]